MTHENDIAKAILNGTNLTLVDAVRLIRSVLDFMPKGSNLTEAQFCTKIIETGKANFRINEMSFANGFNLYYETKKKNFASGFKGLWVQDVLRHTYASYFAKRYSDFPRLQLNMGHRDISLLRSRYVNMQNISKSDAADFFN